MYAQSVNQFHSDIKLTQPEADVKTKSAETVDLEADTKLSDRDTTKYAGRGYGGIREVLAKKGLDELSKRYGSYFPLSASFDATMRADNTPLVMTTVKANQVKSKPKESPFKAGKQAFRAAYGVKTSVHIKQMGIDAELFSNVASESIAKAIGQANEQSTLDVIPHISDILSNSILMGVERIAHTDGKGTALYGYRLYNLYWYNDGKVKAPHCLACTVVQSLDKAEGYVFQNIENVTIDQGLPGNKAGMPSSVNGNAYTVSQLYRTVKKIDRFDGGLQYTTAERDKYLFSYTERNDGTKYSDRDNVPTFYSRMGKVVEGMKQEKFGASSVISMLTGRGVKAEEIRWSGIQEFLDGKKSVTKQELLDFINGSMLHIEEEHRVANEPRDEFVREWHRLVDYYAEEEEIFVGLDSINATMKPYLEELVENGDLNQVEADHLMDLAHKAVDSKDMPTKWHDYKLDGGENYRELVFKMPGATYTNTAMQTHWGADAQGVLAHARIQDFDTFIGNMLFIEEIQSDWHNKGHKMGYDSDITADEREEFNNLEGTIDALNEQREAINQEKGTLDIDYFRKEKMSFDEYSSKSVDLIEKLDKISYGKRIL